MSETGMTRGHTPTASRKDLVSEYNPYLVPYLSRKRETKAGVGQIFEGGDRELIVWQTRPAAPSDYELTLADTLEQIFAQRIHDLPGIVKALNEEGVRAPNGEAWTEASFEQTLRELGKLSFG